MGYHLVLSSSLDLNRITLEAQQGKCPRHVMWDVQQALDATVHTPDLQSIQPIDRIRAKLISRPEHWALARQLAERLGQHDVVYCLGEDVGIPTAILCQTKPSCPKIISFFHSANRPRVQMALRLFGLEKTFARFVSNTESQFAQLRQTLGRVDESRLFYLLEQTDTQFFCPGPASGNKQRPLVASVGLEKRDYRILAEATADLDLDVRISGFSRDVKALAKSFPKTMPANMSCRYYEWQDLVQLYRDADIVILSLFESVDSAGITALLEAMSCGRPVIATQTTGLADYLQNPGTVLTVQPQNLNELKATIAHLLNNPEAAEIQGKQAYKLINLHHRSEQYVETLTSLMRSVG